MILHPHMILHPETLAAMQKHALSAYPNEACGLIVAGNYEPCINVASNPAEAFEIDDVEVARFGDKVEAIVHSHPNGPPYPSEEDMAQQIATDVPWVLIPVFEDRCGATVIWGSEPAPLIGREFVHGVTDCYSLIRDVFALGREKCALQDVDWPFDPIELPDFARANEWWRLEDQNLYEDCFEKAGFRAVPRENARPGDVFLKKVRSEKLTHGGVLLNGGLILHHLPGRLSRREPSALWGSNADMWVRHKNAP